MQIVINISFLVEYGEEVENLIKEEIKKSEIPIDIQIVEFPITSLKKEVVLKITLPLFNNNDVVLRDVFLFIKYIFEKYEGFIPILTQEVKEDV